MSRFVLLLACATQAAALARCADYTCAAFWVKKANAHTVDCGSSCSLTECCYATCGTRTCSAGTVKKIRSETINCESTSCGNSQCCDGSCSGFTCASATYQNKPALVSNDVRCVDRSCQQADCCEEKTCSGVACPSNMLLKDAPETVKCGFSTGCTTAACCNSKVEVPCVHDADCSAAGNTHAKCENNACTCTAGFKKIGRTGGVQHELCIPKDTALVNITVPFVFTLRYPEGKYDELNQTHKENLNTALDNLFQVNVTTTYTRGSIWVTGSGTTTANMLGPFLKGSLHAAAAAASPSKVFGLALNATLSNQGTTCAVNVLGASHTIRVETEPGVFKCLVTRCGGVYRSEPRVIDSGRTTVCELPEEYLRRTEDSDDELNAAQVTGIVAGAVLGVTLIAVVALFFGGGDSAPVEEEEMVKEEA
eukprot:Rhum_TRINITY_DN22795_c0_g1::Rhum_TRINITY_DN22795_c0_g1_i1::g.175937::m.175937